MATATKPATRMTPRHKRWRRFASILEGPLGCNFKERKKDGQITWNCDHTHKKSRRILRMMGYGKDFVNNSVEYFKSKGGHCDCEVLFNVGK